MDERSSVLKVMINQTIDRIKLKDCEIKGDSNFYYLLYKLGQLRMLEKNQNILKEGRALLDTSKNNKSVSSENISNEVKMVREAVANSSQNVLELECLVTVFDIYTGIDEYVPFINEVCDELRNRGYSVEENIIELVSNYMFDKYALTKEKIAKSKKNSDGGRGLGLQAESDMFME